jgi:hypothetical protein
MARMNPPTPRTCDQCNKPALYIVQRLVPSTTIKLDGSKAVSSSVWLDAGYACEEHSK